VDQLMYLKVVFLGYLRQLHQTDQAFTRRLLDEERLLSQEVKEFGEMVGTTMTCAIGSLSSRSASRVADRTQEAQREAVDHQKPESVLHAKAGGVSASYPAAHRQDATAEAVAR
jgi:hypothetical protein